MNIYLQYINNSNSNMDKHDNREDYFRKSYAEGTTHNLGFNDEEEEDQVYENKLKEENYYKYHENV